MKALVKNYFPYEAEEMLYDLEKMKKQGFVLKKIIQNIYIFEPSKNDFKYFVYRIEMLKKLQKFMKNQQMTS